VTRRNDERLRDILIAASAIADHIRHGGLGEVLVFDAVRIRLLEIGEAVNAIDPGLLATEPGIPWGQVTATRNHLAHQYWDTVHAIVESIVTEDLPPLVAAVERLLDHLADSA
jgi:uncharacterized protein with HEPN domain